MDTFEGVQFDPMSLHKYMYAYANPISNIDPSGYSAMSMTLNTALTMMIQFAQIASACLPMLVKTAAIVAGVIATMEMVDFVDDMADIIPDKHTGLFLALLPLLLSEFEKFKKSKHFKGPGNHWVKFWGFSGPTDTTPIRVWVKYISSLTISYWKGGGGGRIFQVQYGIGPNAGGTHRLFTFRIDYLNFKTQPPSPGLHYHLGWGPNSANDHHWIFKI